MRLLAPFRTLGQNPNRPSEVQGIASPLRQAQDRLRQAQEKLREAIGVFFAGIAWSSAPPGTDSLVYPGFSVGPEFCLTILSTDKDTMTVVESSTAAPRAFLA